VTLECPVSVNVLDRKIKVLKMSRNQNRAMAIERFLFSTHQSNAISLNALAYAVQSRPEKVSLRESFVLDFSAVVAGGILAAGAELFPEENISYSVVVEGLFQILAVELRIPAAVGL
jgi:hypothetical protein